MNNFLKILASLFGSRSALSRELWNGFARHVLGFLMLLALFKTKQPCMLVDQRDMMFMYGQNKIKLELLDFSRM